MRNTLFQILIGIILCNSICFSSIYGENIWVGEIIYAPQQESQSTETNTIDLHALSMYSIHQHFILSHITQDIPQQGSILAHLQAVDLLLQTNILQNMEISNDKPSTLQEYLQECEWAIASSEQDILYLQQILPLLKIDLNICVSNKTLADNQYFKSINAYNVLESDLALQQSIQDDQCASEKRIQYNAKSYLLSKLMFYTSTLQSKTKLLSDEQDMIINHLDSIKTDILQKLTTIDMMLKAYTF